MKKNLSIRAKLNIGFSIIVTFLFITIVISFTTISNALVKQESKNLYENIKQTKKIVEVYLKELDKLAMSISRNEAINDLVMELNNTTDEIQSARIKSEIKVLLNKYVFTRDDIASVIVMSENGKASIYGNQSVENVKFNEHKVISDFIRSGREAKWYDTYTEEIASIRGDSRKVITIARKMYSMKSTKSVGYVFFFIKESAIKSLVEDIELDYNGKFIITGQNYNIILNPKEKIAFLTETSKNEYYINEDIYNKIKTIGNGYFSHNKMLFSFSTIDNIAGIGLKWNIVSLTEVKTITSAVKNEGLKVISISIICLILGIFISLIITKDISSKIQQLTQEMDKVKKGDLEITEVKNYPNDEIGYLIRSFSDMIKSLKGLIWNIKKASSVAQASSQNLSSTCQESYAYAEEISSMASEVNRLMNNLAEEVKCEKENIMNIAEIASKTKSSLDSIDNIIFEFRQLGQVNNRSVTILSDMSIKIKNAITGVSSTIKELAEASSKIMKITKDICEMSQETKLLAINSKISGAKISGQSFYSKNADFKVVSDEISKLSDKFKVSATEINLIIKSVIEKVEDSKNSVKELEKVMYEADVSIANVKKSIKDNNNYIDKAVNLNTELHKFIEDIKELSNGIVSSIEIINNSSIEVLENMESIVKAHNEQVEISKFLVDESENLYHLAEDLSAATTSFRG